MEPGQTRSDKAARGTPGHVAEAARQQAESVTSHAREAGANVFNEQRASVACSTQHLASALHDAATQLRDGGESLMGSYADWAADGLERFSEQITREDFDGFISRASRFTRERPEIVFGGALLAGIVLTRLLRQAVPARESAPPVELPMEPMEPLEPIEPVIGAAPYRTEEGF